MAQTFELPDLGEGLHEAEIRDVLVSVGDEVQEGDEIMTVETDKATVEIPSPFSGVVQEIMVEPGDIVEVGDAVMAFSGEEAEEAPEPEMMEEAEEEAEEAEEAEGVAEKPRERPEEEERRERAPEREGPVPAAPATRRLARELEVDLGEVPASGPGGRVTAEDVRAYAEEAPEERERVPEREKPPERAPAGPPVEAAELPDFGRWGTVERMPLRSVRRTTAKRMAQAWAQIPHVSHRDMADVTDLERLRQEHKAEVEAERLTLTVFVMKAAVAALKEHPRFNASLDMENEEIILKQYYHLGMAVDTERGLLVPVIRDVEQKSIAELSVELQELVGRTRADELGIEDLQGGTFTITNVGMLGGVDFIPIINFPQVAILGMAQARWQPVVHRDDHGTMEIVPRYILPLILTFDHRVVDGADAARFMTLIVDILEDPDKLMLKM